MKKLMLSAILFGFCILLLSATHKNDNNRKNHLKQFSSLIVSDGQNRNEDSCFIYIYRVGQFSGALANFSVFVDGRKLCKISNNKFFRVGVTPGKHEITAKVGGIGIMKKETQVDIDAESGGEYYVACNMKSSITRVRLEMIEVTKNSGKKQLENMSEDKCQEKLDN